MPLLYRATAALLAILSNPIQGQHLPGTPGAERYENASAPADLQSPRPIEGVDTVFLEEMTWMEVRDALKAGKANVIIPTGGIEQNGPYVALGKHNLVLRQDCEAIARRLGDTLVASVIPFVPEGHYHPKTHHLRYPGTISVTEETFERLLTDIATSFQVHRFENIFLLGDSGDNQFGMEQVAKKLSAAWSDHPSRIHYIHEYYDPSAIRHWLEERGIHEVDEGLHDRFRYAAQIATLDPRHLRINPRRRAGLTSINGVSLLPLEKTKAIGWQLIDFIAQRTALAIERRIR